MAYDSNPTQRSDRLILISVLLAVLHHTDHVLRADHSGWPFTAQVTPLTFSLAVYPLLLGALFARHSPWLRFALVVPVFGFVQFAHMMIETPHDQYNTWAAGISDFVEAVGRPNLLGLASPLIGYFAVVVSVLLSLSLVAALVSLFRDARRGSLVRDHSAEAEF